MTETPEAAEISDLLGEAITQHQAFAFDDAERLYRSVLARAPGHSDALHNLGVLYAIGLDRPGDALPYFEAALNGGADRPQFWFSYVDALIRVGQGALAEQVLPVAQASGLPLSMVNSLAERLAPRGAARGPLAAYDEGQHGATGADASSDIAPEDMTLEELQAEVLYNQGCSLEAQGRLAEAEAALRAAIGKRPRYFEAHNNLGLVLQSLKRFGQAETCYRAALEIRPDDAAALHNLGNLLQHSGDLDASVALYRRALSRGLVSSQSFENLLFALNYHPDLRAQEIYEGYCEYERRFGAPHRAQWAVHANARRLDRKLKVGYVSPDFQRHPASRFIKPLFAAHDRSHFEIHAYAELAHEDEDTQHYKSLVDHWVPTRGLDDDQLAQRIRSDRIDILVDLAGHTRGNRLGVFARKPAPVSLSWMGYGYTTGLSAIDYFLTDEACVPADADHLFSEQPWRLPGGCAAFRPVQGMGEVGPLPALQGARVTLGSLSRGIRINHHTVRVWARILEELPQAHVVVDSSSFDDEESRRKLVDRFVELGVQPERLHVGYHSPPWDVLRQIDIGLDCFPHNSGTTLYESLYMGVPYVTLAGRPSVGRIGSSILHGVGRPEWIARDEQQYVDKVVALASDLAALARIRAGLRRQMQGSPLMDEAGFVRRVEQAYRVMFSRWCQSRAHPLGLLMQRAQDVFDEGNRLHDAGQRDEAQACYRRAVTWVPEFADAHSNLGLLLLQQGKTALAEACYREAVALQPGSATAHYNLGACLKAAHQLTDAEAAFRAALALKPDFLNALLNLDRVLHAQARGSESEIHWRHALRVHPEFVAGYQHLAVLLRQQHRPVEALACMRKAEELAPDSASVLQGLSAAYRDLGRLDEAEECSRRAVERQPESAVAWNNLAETLNAMQRLTEAEQCFRKAVALDPALAPAHGNLGITLQNQGRQAEAEVCMRQALALNPDDRTAHGNLLFVLNYHPDKSSDEIFSEYRHFDERFYAALRSTWRPHGNAGLATASGPERRLRVGYVSPDFRHHSLTSFLEPVLAQHDKSAVVVYAYAELQREDAMTLHYKQLVDHWVPTRNLSDEALAERIRADGIDILVDLAGHTGGNRLGMFARKPAPVSLSWMGYGCTTGLAAIDYFLGDESLAPVGSERWFSERPWHLPISCVYQPTAEAAMGEEGPSPAARNGYVTFCTLTRAVRINHRTIRVWSDILRRVPQSRLVIDSRSYLDAETQDELARRFLAHGIERERLLIGCHSPPWDVLRSVDIGLDCFPHSSGATLFESLFMGVPFVTLSGRPSVGRVGHSILQSIGRSEWVASTEREYVDKAVALASDVPMLGSLRAGLRQQMKSSPMMDAPGFTRALERGYRQMFAAWWEGTT